MRHAATPNAMPLSRPQWSALLAAVVRELGWGLRAVSREVGSWRARAETIPDEYLRADALNAIDHKRGHTDGAALFWTLPRRRDPSLLQMLVRYELLQDYLDGVSERGAIAGTANGTQLYLALADALDPERPKSDYYRLNPHRLDGGYLDALVDGCREGCRTLPGYQAVRPLLIREAQRSAVLVLNHQTDEAVRDATLLQWATNECPHERDLRWYELTAAASGWITTHALLALAAEREATRAHAEATYGAYFPSLATALTMLDSYVDQVEDRLSGDHSYVAHYPNAEVAEARLVESIQRAASDVLALPNGERHAVLLGCMIALYLSKDSARTADMRASTRRIAAAGGSLPRLVMPALRAWRICNAQRSAT